MRWIGCFAYLLRFGRRLDWRVVKMDWGLVAKLLPKLLPMLPPPAPPGLEGWWLFDKRVSSWSCKTKRIFFHPSFNITASESDINCSAVIFTLIVFLKSWPLAPVVSSWVVATPHGRRAVAVK